MAVEDVAGSGLDEGNTGAAEQVKGGGLDAALDKAFASVDNDGEGDVPLETVKAKMDKDASSKSRKADAETTAGDKPDQKAKLEGQGELPLGTVPTEAPKHWPEDRRKAFAALAPEAQKLVLAQSKEIEGGYTKKSMELSDTVKYADAIRGLFNDDRTKHQLANAGLDEVGYVRYLHSLQNFATSDPVRYVAWAMQNLGVRPEQLGIGQAQRAPQQQAQPESTGDPRLDELLMDPAVKQLRDQLGQQSQVVQQLQARLAQEDQQRQQYQTNQQRQAQQQLTAMWTNFRSAIDDHGQLAHPHADTLMQQMGAIMETDPEISPMPDGPDKLKAAYDAAIWARPSLRSSRLEAETAKAQAAAQKAAEAERAKRAAGPKRPQGAPANPVKKSGLDGALEAAMASLGQN